MTAAQHQDKATPPKRDEGSEAGLAERYPDRRNRARDRVIATTVGAVSLLAFIVWAVLVTFAQASEVKAKTLSYRIVDSTSAEVRFELSRPAGTEAYCVIQALSESYLVVGWKQLTLEAGTETTEQFSASLVTTEAPVTAMVDRCWSP